MPINPPIACYNATLPTTAARSGALNTDELSDRLSCFQTTVHAGYAIGSLVCKYDARPADGTLTLIEVKGSGAPMNYDAKLTSRFYDPINRKEVVEKKAFASNLLLEEKEIHPGAVVLVGYNAEPTNGGINPEGRAALVTVSFMAGSKPCFASSYGLSIQQFVIGKAVHIVVLRKALAVGPRICTAQYQPVTKILETRIFGFAGDGKIIVVDNVGILGHDEIVNH